MSLHLGIADHLGWAVAVTVSDARTVVDRRRIELIGPHLPAAPVHHVGGPHELHRTGDPLSDAELADLVARVQADATSVIDHQLDVLVRELPGPVASMSLRSWPPNFPADIATQRRAPFESRADPIMYRRLLALAASARGWRVHHFDAKAVTARARAVLGDRTGADPLQQPRDELGPPWTADHRTAFAAAIVAT